MLTYPADVTRDGNGLLVSFPDIPEAITCGADLEEAIDMARDALKTAMDFYFEDRRRVPAPSPMRAGQVAIDLPASIAAKVLLLNEMVEQGLRPSELARKMGVRPQEVTRLLNLYHPTKIDTISAALMSMGRQLELKLA